MEKEIAKNLHKEKRMSTFLSFSVPLKYMFILDILENLNKQEKEDDYLTF